MSQPPIVLPISTVQPDFESIITDVEDGMVPEDSFWVSCYKTGENSVHGKVRLTLNEHDRNVVDYEGQDGVQFSGRRVERDYTVACPSLAMPFTRLAVPVKVYAAPSPQVRQDVYRKISAFDVAPDGSQLATGYDDGSVYIMSTVFPSAPPSTARKCHLSTVTSLRFFPSSTVLLTAGGDFTLSILPADPTAPSIPPHSDPIRISPVRTLKGHTRVVTSTGIISRGRTVISGAKDATVRLWDVSSGNQIRMLGTAGLSPVLAMSLGERGEGAFVTPPDGESNTTPISVDPREVETQDKIVFCALSNGVFQAFDLGTKLSVFHSQAVGSSAALQAISYSPAHNLVATGSEKGVIRVYDTRSLGVPLVSFSRNSASIEDLVFLSLSQAAGSNEVGLAVATEDGLPYIANVRPEGPSARAELVGTDCDAVRSVRVGSHANAVWTAGDDGVIRRYERLGEENGR